MRSVEIKVKGRVQGVGFRYHTREKAKELDIRGFVKNLSDGSVYILAQGNEANLDEFIKWCHNGPRLSIVKSVDVTETTENELEYFDVR